MRLITLITLTMFSGVIYISSVRAEDTASSHQQSIKQTEEKIKSLDAEIKQAKGAHDKTRVTQLTEERNSAKKELASLKKEEKQAQKENKKALARERAEAVWETYPADKKLCTAIKFNRADLVTRVLTADATLAAKSSMECQFPLGEAAEKDNLEIAEILLKHGAQFEMPLAMGMSVSALEIAASSRKNHVKMIEFLIVHGAPIKATNQDNVASALVRSSSSVEQQNVKQQHNMTAENLGNGNVLNRVINKGNLANIEALLQHGINPNSFMMASSVLMDAAATLNLERVKLLLKYHADINLKGPGNQTALSRVENIKTHNDKSKAKKQAMIDLLLSSGAIK